MANRGRLQRWWVLSRFPPWNINVQGYLKAQWWLLSIQFWKPFGATSIFMMVANSRWFVDDNITAGASNATSARIENSLPLRISLIKYDFCASTLPNNSPVNWIESPTDSNEVLLHLKNCSQQENTMIWPMNNRRFVIIRNNDSGYFENLKFFGSLINSTSALTFKKRCTSVCSSNFNCLTIGACDESSTHGMKMWPESAITYPWQPGILSRTLTLLSLFGSSSSHRRVFRRRQKFTDAVGRILSGLNTTSDAGAAARVQHTGTRRRRRARRHATRQGHQVQAAACSDLPSCSQPIAAHYVANYLVSSHACFAIARYGLYMQTVTPIEPCIEFDSWNQTYLFLK